MATHNGLQQTIITMVTCGHNAKKHKCQLSIDTELHFDLGLLAALVAAWLGHCWACTVRLADCNRNVEFDAAPQLPSTKGYLITSVDFKWFGLLAFST